MLDDHSRVLCTAAIWAAQRAARLARAMRDTTPARAQAEMAFRRIEVTPEQKLDAMAEYRAKQAAQLANMDRLRAMRMAKGKR
jgi:hypothetical protein